MKKIFYAKACQTRQGLLLGKQSDNSESFMLLVCTSRYTDSRVSNLITSDHIFSSFDILCDGCLSARLLASALSILCVTWFSVRDSVSMRNHGAFVGFWAN